MEKDNLSLASALSLQEDQDQRQWELMEFSISLLQAVLHESEHFTRLDAHFATLTSYQMRFIGTRAPGLE